MYLLMLYIKYKVEKEMVKEKPLLKHSHSLQGVTYTCHPRLKLQGPETLCSRQLHGAAGASFDSLLTQTLRCASSFFRLNSRFPSAGQLKLVASREGPRTQKSMENYTLMT